MIIIILCLNWLAIYYQPFTYQSLHFVMEKWVLADKQGNIIEYDTTKVIIDAGLFFLLALSTEHQRKVVMIFFDQLSADEYRFLRLMEKTR